jgi:hypothetical protein
MAKLFEPAGKQNHNGDEHEAERQHVEIAELNEQDLRRETDDVSPPKR